MNDGTTHSIMTNEQHSPPEKQPHMQTLAHDTMTAVLQNSSPCEPSLRPEPQVVKDVGAIPTESLGSGTDSCPRGALSGRSRSGSGETGDGPGQPSRSSRRRTRRRKALGRQQTGVREVSRDEDAGCLPTRQDLCDVGSRACDTSEQEVHSQDGGVQALHRVEGSSKVKAPPAELNPSSSSSSISQRKSHRHEGEGVCRVQGLELVGLWWSPNGKR